jgi:hypothetical protein
MARACRSWCGATRGRWSCRPISASSGGWRPCRCVQRPSSAPRGKSRRLTVDDGAEGDDEESARWRRILDLGRRAMAPPREVQQIDAGLELRRARLGLPATSSPPTSPRRSGSASGCFTCIAKRPRAYPVHDVSNGV